MAEKFVGMVALKAIIVHEGRVLLMQNAQDSKWQFPGGRMHVGEKPEEGVRREVKEELGVDVLPTSVVQTDVFQNAQNEPVLVLMFLCGLLDNVTDLKGDGKEVKDFRWVGPDEIASLDIWPVYIEPLKKVLLGN